MVKMVKVKLMFFDLIVLVILAIVQTSSQASLNESIHLQKRQTSVKNVQERSAGTGKIDGSFVFPGDEKTRKPQSQVESRFNFSLNNSPPCDGNSLFCERVPNYPLNYINSVIKKEGDKFKGFFNNDILASKTDSVQDRTDFQDDNPLCQSEEKIIFPQAGINGENEWKVIVNTENLKQGIRVEICINNGAKCSNTENFPFGLAPECKQRFLYRTLVVVDNNGTFAQDRFKVFSCCKCIVKSVGNRIADRMANVPLPLTIPKTTPTSVLKSRN